MWSPPFLWPGHAIQYYSVFITNMTDGITTYHKVNSRYNDVTVTYTRQIPADIFTCTEITFGVSAVNQSGFALHNFTLSSESCMHLFILYRHNIATFLYHSSSLYTVVEMSTRVVKFLSNAISTRALYKEDDSFAFVEAYIQVSFL